MRGLICVVLLASQMDGHGVELVDSHCHMSADEFVQDLNDVIKRKKQPGVKALIAVTEGASEFKRVIKLSKTYPNLIFPCFGIHPLQSSEQALHSVRFQKVLRMEVMMFAFFNLCSK